MSRKFSIVALITSLVAAVIPAHALDVGERAAPFEAQSTSGTVKLGDFIGKSNLVLAFYFADFTPV